MAPTTEAEFLEYVQSGGLVETGDWMPDEYRARLIKFIEMHGNSELMGVLPEREWILRAPTLQRKLALTAKVQDEVGHAQLIYRVVEDLGKPREQCLDDLISGKSKFHNVFHYPTKTWGDVGVIAWLVDAAAIISPEGAPQVLVRAVRADHEEDLLGGVVPHPPRPRRHPRDGHGHDGAARARAGGARPLVGAADAVPRQPDPRRGATRCSCGGSRARPTRRRASSSSTATCRRSWELGLTIPDPELRKNEDGVWEYTEPDWDELKSVVTGHGPMTAERLDVPRVCPRENAPGCGAWCSPRRRDLGGLPAGARGRRRSSTPARSRRPTATFAESRTRRSSTAGAPSRSRCGSFRATPCIEVDEPTSRRVFDRNYRRVDGYSLKVKLKEARERAGTAKRD